MSMIRILAVALGLLITSVHVPAAYAQGDTDQDYRFPRWMMEIKGGRFYPTLEDYETFYGSDNTPFYALSFAYRIKSWLEAGGELGYMRDTGVGALPGSGQLGGSVTYKLIPVQAFANFRYDRSRDQLFVPYAGVGLVSSYYEQKIEFQSDRTGWSDLGASIRVGIQLSLNRLDPRNVNQLNYGLKRSFFFLEAQRFTTKVDGDDLGGDIYMLGLRFEWDTQKSAAK